MSRNFPGSLVGPIFRRSDRGHDPAPCVGERLFSSSTATGLADRGADRQNIARRGAAQKASQAACMTAIISPEGKHLAPPLTQGEGISRRRPRHEPDRQAQADDGFGRSLCPTRTPKPRPRQTGRPAPMRTAGAFSVKNPDKPKATPTMKQILPTELLINELQSFGVRLVDPKAGADSRRGGAGPSDHKAVTIDGVTVMAPVAYRARLSKVPI